MKVFTTSGTTLSSDNVIGAIHVREEMTRDCVERKWLAEESRRVKALDCQAWRDAQSENASIKGANRKIWSWRRKKGTSYLINRDDVCSVIFFTALENIVLKPQSSDTSCQTMFNFD